MSPTDHEHWWIDDYGAIPVPWYFIREIRKDGKFDRRFNSEAREYLRRIVALRVRDAVNGRLPRWGMERRA